MKLVLNLNSIEKVKNFCNEINKFTDDFDLSCDHYIVDAKSIMGIFSLDLSRPVTLTSATADKTAVELVLKDCIL